MQKVKINWRGLDITDLPLIIKMQVSEITRSFGYQPKDLRLLGEFYISREIRDQDGEGNQITSYYIRETPKSKKEALIDSRLPLLFITPAPAREVFLCQINSFWWIECPETGDWLDGASTVAEVKKICKKWGYKVIASTK